MNNVLYVANAGFPIDATGIRIKNIGDLLESLGYNVHYICNKEIKSVPKNCSYLESATNYDNSYNDLHFKINNKVYSYLKNAKHSKLNNILNVIELITANNLYKRVKFYIEKENPKFIILYNADYQITKKLTKYCKKLNIKVIVDDTEWYDVEGHQKLVEKIYLKSVIKRITKEAKKIDGAISISKFFDNYYKNLGVKSIFIPALMDIEKIENFTVNNPLSFVYAGSPGNKDILTPFINAIKKINEGEIKFNLHLVGITYNDLLLKNISCSEKDGIYAYGRLLHEDVVRIIKNCDFSFLLRHNKIYAKAGFSTKTAECMSLGLPLIFNKVGGTDLIIEDGVDGFLIDDYNEDTILKKLNEIYALSKEEIISIKESAYNKANVLFLKDNYVDNLHKFIEGV